MIAQNEINEVHLVGSWRTVVGDMDTYGMRFHEIDLN